MTDSTQDDGRRRHYGGFYGLEQPERSDAPLAMVLGNCQAEALRVSIGSVADGARPALDTVRIPPVHEMVADDLPHLHRLLEQVDVLVVQPVRDGYRDLPLGTEQVVARLRRDATAVRVPGYYFTGLHPYQVLVRGEGIVDPPLVPYHDIRRLAEAAGRRWSGPAPATTYRAIADDSLAELTRREEAAGALPLADVVAAAGARAGHTVDHPGNPVLRELGVRVLDHLGLPDRLGDPGRELLRSVRSPLAPEVVDALALDAEPTGDWVVEGETVGDDQIGEAHRRWYAEHPEAVALAMRKHAALLDRLGLAS